VEAVVEMLPAAVARLRELAPKTRQASEPASQRSALAR